MAAPKGGKEFTNDERVVVVVDDIHFPISRFSHWLWLGLPQMGAAVPEIHSAASWCAGSDRRRDRSAQPSGLGMGGDFVWAVVFVGLLWAVVTLWWR